MMEMQDTINELQRELSALGKSTRKTRSASSSLHGGTVSIISNLFSYFFLGGDYSLLKLVYFVHVV